MKNINILITSAGRRVSLVKAFQNELKEFNKFGKVFTTDLNPKMSSACNISDRSFIISKVNSQNYINELLTICKNNNIGLIIPTLDTELQVLAENKKKFEQNNIQVIVSNIGFIQNCRDKRKTNKFFQEKGINIPREIDKHNPSFPLFIKPYNGSLSAEIHIIENEDSLNEYLLTNDKFMFMEYISPKKYNEYTIDMYYDKKNILKCIVPRLRIEVRGGEVSKAKTVNNELVLFFFKKLSFIEGAIGCLTLQVFFNETSKDIIGIEINPRFGGGFPLTYKAGGNFPKYIIAEYLDNKEILIQNSWQENLTMLRYDAEVFV